MQSSSELFHSRIPHKIWAYREKEPAARAFNNAADPGRSSMAPRTTRNSQRERERASQKKERKEWEIETWLNISQRISAAMCSEARRDREREIYTHTCIHPMERHRGRMYRIRAFEKITAALGGDFAL